MNWDDVPGGRGSSSFQGGISLILGSVLHNIVKPSGITCMRINPQHRLASSPSSDGLGRPSHLHCPRTHPRDFLADLGWSTPHSGGPDSPELRPYH